jgi:predicted DNA binding protein
LNEFLTLWFSPMIGNEYSLKIIEVYHEGDYLCDIAYKEKIVLIDYLSLIKNDSYIRFYIFPTKKTFVEEALEYADCYNDVKRATIVTGPGIEPFIYMVKKNYGVLKAMAKTESIKMEPIIVQHGKKYFPTLIPRGKEGKLTELIRKYAPTRASVRILHPNTHPFFSGSSISPFIPLVHPKLTAHESLVLEEAFRRGYFEWPRKITLKELSRMLGVAPSTILEHIRKAERKILREYLEKKHVF